MLILSSPQHIQKCIMFLTQIIMRQHLGFALVIAMNGSTHVQTTSLAGRIGLVGLRQLVIIHVPHLLTRNVKHSVSITRMEKDSVRAYLVNGRTIIPRIRTLVSLLAPP